MKMEGNAGNKLLVLVAVILILLILSPPKEKNVLVSFSGKSTITAEVAGTPYLREKGLMFVRSLPQDYGMLFIFETPQQLRFWMKNTLIPLDIIFISENFTVVNIAENAQPCSEYCPLYVSAAPAKYVVEVNAGFAERNGIEVGDGVRIE